MGWMSWEIFRCETDCTDYPNDCINQQLYEQQTDALVAGGYLAAGYNGIHIDDCWPQETPTRVNGQLVPDPIRFPSGFVALGQYMHNKSVQFGLYTAESYTTCAGYPASEGYETTDADTFASWGVDYMKVDGCGSESYYPIGYPDMGTALEDCGRNIVYSCSWPAYLGNNESTKPYAELIAIGCNLWRNWDDIQCSWSSMESIIDHWGDWGPVLQQWAGPGHWNDPDMLLIGNDCISDDEARTQMAIWSIVAAPLIMGNDLRNVTSSTQAILLNKEAIAVDQDPMGMQGLRITPAGNAEIWARNLSDGTVAVGLLNKEGNVPPPAPCTTWNYTTGGYLEACGGSSGNEECFSGVPLVTAQNTCCSDPDCAGFSYDPTDGSGCYKLNTNCGFVNNSAYVGYDKPNFVPPTGTPVNITINFASVGLSGSIMVRDIWQMQNIGVYTNSYTAINVPYHGTAFLKLTPQTVLNK
jgi:alpha-N-acetylgalactosaminidase